MPSLSELRKKIKGVASTRKITRAMKMVAGARFGRAQSQLVGARKFRSEIEHIFSQILAASPEVGAYKRFILPDASMGTGKKGLLVVAGDKGLCGDFNNSVFRESDKFIKSASGSVSVVIAIGRKACDHYKKFDSMECIQYPNIFSNLDFQIADKIGREILDIYNKMNLSSIHVGAASFLSMMKHTVAVKPLIPFPVTPASVHRDMLFEPEEPGEHVAGLVPLMLRSMIYHIIRESYVAELAARMRAMDNATTNAGSLIDKITLEMNKVRQATITREIAEIIATNEVVK